MYRIAYSKEGPIRFISHLDLIRTWQRSFRRAGLPVRVSRGFSPHPLISFGPPLPVGIAGRNELLDVDLDGEVDPAEIARRLEPALPGGVRVRSVGTAPAGRSLCDGLDRASYEALVEGADPRVVRRQAAAAMRAERLVVSRRTEKGVRCRDLRPLIQSLAVDDAGVGAALLRFTVAVGGGGNVNPVELISAVLEWPEDRVKTLPIVRTGLFSSRGAAPMRPQGPPSHGAPAAGDLPAAACGPERTWSNGQADRHQRRASGDPRGDPRGRQTAGNPHRAGAGEDPRRQHLQGRGPQRPPRDTGRLR
ncbi:MAG: TIGR03936 family radical SAM-associated protein [bacterium]|nr:TIGR03936 family radical SAM-associated protein [bacterium]